MTHHWERRGAAACGAPGRTVEKPAMASCAACRDIAGVGPAVEIRVRRLPGREELLKLLILTICDAAPADRRALCEDALRAVGAA